MLANVKIRNQNLPCMSLTPDPILPTLQYYEALFNSSLTNSTEYQRYVISLAGLRNYGEILIVHGVAVALATG